MSHAGCKSGISSKLHSVSKQGTSSSAAAAAVGAGMVAYQTLVASQGAAAIQVCAVLGNVYTHS